MRFLVQYSYSDNEALSLALEVHFVSIKPGPKIFSKKVLTVH